MKIKAFFRTQASRKQLKKRSPASLALQDN